MNFCKNCDNLYYIKISEDDENALTYYCRKCGDENDSIITNLENICVSKSQKVDNDGSYKHIVNKYTKFDPTLPRIYNIKCVNEDCISNNSKKKKIIADDDESKEDKLISQNEETEIIYLRYDDKNMRFVYICTHCDTVWKSSDNN
mgnify:FL=1